MSTIERLSDPDRDVRAWALCELLGIERVGRMRGGWVEVDADGELAVVIRTRNGGGNRECWNENWGDEKPTNNSADCDCVGCLQTYVLPTHPLYLRDEDDDFDCTFCFNYFRVPPEHVETLRPFAEPAVEGA